MEKSKQTERIAIKIQEGLQMWKTIRGTPETKLEYEIKQFPKIYHLTEDSITIPLFTNGKKIIVEIKGIED
jgi:TATA-box binding protein (TBP) (component of TFIID and TFIIIB)